MSTCAAAESKGGPTVPRIVWDPLNAWPAGRKWLWVVLALLTCWWQGPSFIGSLRPARDEGVDFFQDWASARNLFSGLAIYTPHEVAVERHLGFRPAHVNHPLNAHPPACVLVAAPFAVLDYPDAALAWNAASLGILALSLWAVARALGIPLRPWSVFPLLALALTCNPLKQQVIQGQSNLLLLGLVTGIWLADRSERHVAAGVLLGIASALKLFPALLFLYFAARCRWKVIAAGLVAVALVTLSTIVVLGTESWSDYLHKALPSITQYPWRNMSIWGLWGKLCRAPAFPTDVEGLWESPPLARAGSIVSCALMVAALAWLAWLSRSRLQRDHAFALATVTMLLVSPTCWTHYFLLLAPALAIMWVQLRPTDLDRATFLLILAVFWIPIEQICEKVIPPGRVSYSYTLTLLCLPIYSLLAMFLFTIGQWCRARGE